MLSRDARFLQQLGIVTYQLRRPDLLKGESAVHLLPSTRVILVISDDETVSDEFIKDILLAMCLSRSELMIIPKQQLPMLPNSHHCTLWYAGVTLTDTPAKHTLSTPALVTLQQSALAKRDFWQQITATYD